MRSTYRPADAAYTQPGGTEWYTYPSVSEVLGQTAAELWRTQPYLRTVVDFLARNIAQLGLHLFTRSGDTDRTRITSGPVFAVFAQPNPSQTMYELINSLVSDLALYDNAYWLIGDTGIPDRPFRIEPIPAEWVISYRRVDVFTISHFVVRNPDGAFESLIPADRVVHFHGWDPSTRLRGTSRVETLKLLLAEQIEAQQYRQQIWRNGGRVGAVLTRPVGAPSWSDTAKNQFREDWRANWTGRKGPKAGGTPILEDGMDLKRIGYSAQEDQFVDVAKLALNVVAGVYHVNPTMVGQLDNANYSNVREFRRMLYGDTLGPTLAMIEGRINTFLLPLLGASPDTYSEFNVMAKLQGSFEEQASVMSTMVGRPIMTANEGRARFNLPAVTDDPTADELIVPLNVTVGGQPSPQTPTAVPTPGGAARLPSGTKSKPTQDQVDDAVAVLRKYYENQGNGVVARYGATKDLEALETWWTKQGWDDKLSADLLALMEDLTGRTAADVLTAHGYDPASYDTGRTVPYLSEISKSRAQNINETTWGQIKTALSGVAGAAALAALRQVYSDARDVRAPQGGQTLATTAAGFGTSESAKQRGGRHATKTWHTTSAAPRKSHADMNGQTVGINDKFSNGAEWPGDAVLGADGTAGCECIITVNF